MRCLICGTQLPDEEPREVPRRYCGRKCRLRAKHRREYARMTPDVARESECGRKVRHTTQREAEVARADMARRGDDLAIYRCRWCQGWHLGGYAAPPTGDAQES